MDQHESNANPEAEAPTWTHFATSLELLRQVGEFVPHQTSREDFFLDQVVELLGLRAALLFRGELLEHGAEPLRMVSFHERGFDPEARVTLAEYTEKNGQDDPTIPASLQRMQGVPLWTPRAFRRQELIDDEVFYSLPHYQGICRLLDCDERLQVVLQLSRTRVSCLSLHRRHGAPAFDRREARLAELLFGQASHFLGWPALPLGGVLRTTDGATKDLAEVEDSFESRCLAFELSKREREVAYWVQQGLSNKEIARELSISDQTVKRHLSKVFKKSNSMSRTELAMRLGH